MRCPVYSMATSVENTPHLYLIATPIGNLRDITLRALDVLREVDIVLCEDTRHTKKLLHHYDITTPLMRLDDHTEARKVPDIIEKMSQGTRYGLVADAGTPLISDAGYVLVKAVHVAGLQVSALPGPCAVISALVSAGVPCVPFYFAGFLPHKKGRKSRIQALQQHPTTWVLFESPHRLIRTLQELAAVLGAEKTIVVAKELTKWYEKILSNTIEQHIAYFQKSPPKGEYVLVYPPQCTK